MKLRRFLILSAFIPLGCRSSSPPPPPPPAETGDVRFPSDGRSLRGSLFRPPVDGRFPAVVYNHGSERDPSLEFLGELGAFFQSHGYVVLFPYRRGSGGSEGAYWRDEVEKHPEAERSRAAVAQLEVENADVVAAIQFLRTQPFVDGAAISVAGCSFGGIHTVLTAEKDLGLWAAVDFAGASMSWAKSVELQDRMKTAARAAKVPVFFVQAENDFDTTPSLVLSGVMRDAGKPERMKIFPPHGTTPMAGHAHFCNHGMNEWGDEVLAFLKEPRK